MPVAAARMIDAWLPDDGGFVEALRFVLMFDRLDEIEEPGDPEYGPWMRRLAWRIADRFCEQARDGNLITGLRRVGGADAVLGMPREWWDVEDPLLRFRSFSIDPADRLADGPSLPFWIWVAADSLETILARIPNEHCSAFPAPGMPNAEFLKLDAIPLRDAVGVIADAVPAGQVAAAAAILVNLCATGVVQAYAGHMYRTVGDGRDVEAVPNWPIPAGHWDGLIDDARSDWNGGHLQATMPPDVFRFRRVQIDRKSLFEALQSLGWVAQARVWEPLRNINWRGYIARSRRPGSEQRAPESSSEKPKKLGRPTGATNYPSDTEIVKRVIALCDEGEFTGKARLRHAIQSLVTEIEPPALDDEAKIKRIRPKVIALRADLAN
ncbi:hypothetical protein [Sphingomonas sp.]|uniref:hypothetical protein n=1 Tax=Sphingomonas sp. TaxID=28214 RepID=UPI003BACEC27